MFDIPEDGRILFYLRDRATFGFLSHFHPARFVLDGKDWPSVEHFYQAQKSFDPAYRAAIRAAPHPAAAKALAAPPERRGKAGKRSWFRNNEALPRPDWDGVKLDIMRRADFAKYSQNAELAEWLLATGTAQIVEDAPRDAFWGTGPNGAGMNWSGRILMEVREQLS